jgi:hypothetical protein
LKKFGAKFKNLKIQNKFLIKNKYFFLKTCEKLWLIGKIEKS